MLGIIALLSLGLNFVVTSASLLSNIQTRKHGKDHPLPLSLQVVSLVSAIAGLGYTLTIVYLMIFTTHAVTIWVGYLALIYGIAGYLIDMRLHNWQSTLHTGANLVVRVILTLIVGLLPAISVFLLL